MYVSLPEAGVKLLDNLVRPKTVRPKNNRFVSMGRDDEDKVRPDPDEFVPGYKKYPGLSLQGTKHFALRTLGVRKI